MRAQLGFALLVILKYLLEIANSLGECLLIYYIAEKITKRPVFICTTIQTRRIFAFTRALCLGETLVFFGRSFARIYLVIVSVSVC